MTVYQLFDYYKFTTWRYILNVINLFEILNCDRGKYCVIFRITRINFDVSNMRPVAYEITLFFMFQTEKS